MTPGSGNGGNFTVKEIVVEIRDTVRELAVKVDTIDRQGSIGTKAQLQDHEQQLRRNTERVTQLEATQLKRADLHELKADIAGIKLALATSPPASRVEELAEEIDSLQTWRAITSAAVAALVFVIPVLATVSWHVWG